MMYGGQNDFEQQFTSRLVMPFLNDTECQLVFTVHLAVCPVVVLFIAFPVAYKYIKIGML